MIHRLTLLLVLLALPAVGAAPSDENAILARLQKEHPRLLARASDFQAIKQRGEKNPQLAEWIAHLRKEADALTAAAPVKYEIPDGKRLLAVSRRTADRAGH